MPIPVGTHVGPILRVVSAMLVVFVAWTFYLLLLDPATHIWQLILMGIFVMLWCGLFGYASVVGRAPAWFVAATTHKNRR